MAGLKIYACSGIGDTQEMQYWSDNTNVASNTQAVNTLLSLINLTYTEATCLKISDTEKIEKLNKIDLYTVCLNAAYTYKDNPVELHQAGEVIGTMVKDGLFNSKTLNLKKRDTHLDEMLQIAADMMQRDRSELHPDEEFMAWYFDHVEIRNKVGLTKAQQKRGQEVLQEASVNGIGANDDWKEDASISEYLLNASDYFLYIFLTDEQVKDLSYVIKTKRNTQYEYYNFCKSVFTDMYGSEDEMRNIIRTGIIQESGDTPENLCAALYEAEMDAKPISNIPIAVMAEIELVIKLLIVIVSILSAITAIIKVILEYCARVKEAQYAAMDSALTAGGAPSADDLENQKLVEEYKAEQQRERIKKWIAPIGLGLVGLYLIFKK